MVEVLRSDFIEAAKKVIGNDYGDDYHVAQLILKEIKSMLNSKGVDQEIIDQISFSLGRHKKQLIYITYRLNNIIWFDIKKKKGNTHYCYGKQYINWTIKDIIADDYTMTKAIKDEETGLYNYIPKTLEEAISDVEKYIDACQEKAKKDRALQIEAIKCIAEKFSMSIEEVYSLCTDIKKNWYDLTVLHYNDELKTYTRAIIE